MASTELSVMLTAKGNLENELRSARDRVRDLSNEIRKANANGEQISESLADEYRQATREAKKLSDQVNRTNQNIRKTTMKSTTAVGQLGDAIVKHQTAIRNAGLVAAGALIFFGKQAIQAFSEVEDATSALEATFGATGSQMVKWAQTSGDAFNLSQREALNAALTFAVFGETAGLAGKDLVDFTTGLAERAADLASFFGGSTAEAITAMGAAMRGEYEPGKRYAILINEMTLKAKAMEMGIADGTGQLNTQQKILASHALIMDQTTRAQGDVARTADSMANQIKDASQQFDDLKASSGAELAKAAGPVLKIFNSFLKTFNDLPGPVKGVTLGVLALSAAAMIATPKIIALNAALAAQGGIAGLGVVGRNAGAAARGLTAVTVAMVGLRAMADEQGNVFTMSDFYEGKSLDTAFKDVISPSVGQKVGNFIAGISDVLVPHNTALDDARSKIAAYDQELVNLVVEGKLPEAERRFQSLAREAEQWGGTVDQLRDSLPGYAAALDAAKSSSDGLADATGDAADEVNGLVAAMSAFMGIASQQQALRTWRQTVKKAIAKPSADAAYSSIAAFDRAFASFEAGSEEQARFVIRNYDTLASAIKNSGLKKAQQDQLLAPLQAARDEAQQVINKLNEIDGSSVDAQIRYYSNLSSSAAAFPGRARGGLVSGPGTGTSDSIPTMLSNGEFVLRAAAVRAIGSSTLKQLNRADKMTDPALLTRLQARTAGSSLAAGEPSGPLIGAIHVHNPARDVDIEAAVTRGLAKARRIERERGGRG